LPDIDEWMDRAPAFSEERFIRKADEERGLNSGSVGLADASTEDEAASRWADCAVAYGDC